MERGRDQVRLVTGILIVVASVAGAGAVWQAAANSARGADLHQQAMQQLVFVEQRRSRLQANVAQDFQLFGSYQEHVMMWHLLREQAAEVEARDHALSDRLRGQARTELGLARSLAVLFAHTTPELPGEDDDGVVEFDPDFLIRYFEGTDLELVGIDPTDGFRRAIGAYDRSVGFVGVAVWFAAALFFLTLAEFARRRTRVIYLGSGMVAIVVGVTATLLEVAG